MKNQPSVTDYQTVFEAVPGHYLILDPKLTIVAVSNAYLAATMTKRNEIVGRGLFEVFPDNPDDSSATGVSNLRASLNRVLEKKVSDSMAIQKYDIRRPDSLGGGFEERHWSPTNIPILGNDQELKYIIHRAEDVTDLVLLRKAGIEQHQLAEELRSQASQDAKVRQSQRMEAMGQLAGGVAHDFNNMLAIIMMNAEIMLRRGEISAAARKSFEQIKKTSERAATLTRQLLAFSRRQVLQPRTLNLNTVVSEVESMLKRLLTADVELETKLHPDLLNTRIDPTQVEQIILNLVVNARDAMPKGGKITIETSNTQMEHSQTTGTIKVSPGKYVLLTVTDTGTGMDAKVQARIFEPFFTTKEIGKGTGLGLATVYGIVSQNNGTIWVYSEPQHGTVFKIYLPVISEEVPFQEQKKNSTDLIGMGQNILVVEDQDDLREVICTTLKNHGYTVHQASDGTVAWDLVQNINIPFDLVVTDVVMPHMGGKDLAQKINQLRPNIKVLFLSGYTGETLEQHGISGNDLHFLEKPFGLDSLLAKIGDILNERGSIKPKSV